LTAVLLALSASFAWGFADFGAGAAARKLQVFVVAAISQTVGLAVAAAVVLISGRGAPPAAQLAWAAGAGLVGGFGLSAFYKAMAVGAMGIIGPITATAAAVPVAYGLARGERPSMLQGIGVGLAVFGVIGASVEPLPEHGGRRKLGAGVGLALVAALAFGCGLIGLSRAASGGTVWAVFMMRLVVVPVAIALALLVKGRLPASSRLWLLLVGVGVVDTGATLLYAAATTRGLLSVVTVLAALYPIVMLVLARVLLAERIARPQLAGVGVALAGVVLISAG
jgi:drug/metabolite transporter (DMT)-like permease